MSFGDVLRKKIHLLSFASESKFGTNAFWEILKRIAVEDIYEIYPQKVDSDIAIPIYFEILQENESLLPVYFCQKLPSNHQERYRVINRNLFSSNAFHPDGLANQEGILAHKEINVDKKGYRIVYQRRVKHDSQ
jgi:hypothetical protein